MLSYLITDPKYYTNNPLQFTNQLRKSLTKYSVNIASFRDTKSSNNVELSKIFVNLCKKHSVPYIYLHHNYNLAHKLHATGVHLSSHQFNDIEKAKQLGLKVVISTHNEFEINQAIKSNVDMITYSPIFNTPNKGQPVGIDTLDNICKKFSTIKIIALGGVINKEHINQIRSTTAFGFASIRYFIN